MKTIIVLIIICIATISCKNNKKPVQQKLLGAQFQRTVDSVKDLHHQLKWPDHLTKRNGKKRGDEFDVQRYFTVLKHLSMQSGYVLDYVYNSGNRNSNPTLYARRTDQKPYETFSEFENAIRERAQLDEVDKARQEYIKTLRKFILNDEDSTLIKADKKLQKRLAQLPNHKYWKWYLDHVHIDSTDQGYLEYITLYLLGGQFYLFWHSQYDDIVPIADSTAIDTLFSGPIIDDIYMPDDLRKKTDTLDLEPRVEIHKEEVNISIITFSKWGGFQRKNFTIARFFPHKIIREKTTTLIAYHCGIEY